MRILGIETSCDETAVAIVEDGKKILTNVVASSAEIHRKYGGIVPEVAARKQLESMIPVLTEAMTGFTKDDIDALAVTVGPGLIGSLLVGVETAKTLSFAWNKPIIPVNHVLAHIYAAFLGEPLHSSPLVKGRLGGVKFPAIALVVSGGHTELYLMKNERSLKWLGGTLDDAAGECFDKTARLLGLPYPGGPEIATAAAKSISHLERSERSRREAPQNASLDFSGLTPRNDKLVKLPRPMIHDDSLNFSFSGLKTAVMREWKKYDLISKRHSGKSGLSGRIQNPQKNRSWTSQDDEVLLISTFSHEIQEAITDVLVKKTLSAAQKFQAKSVIVAGGVAANQRLTEKFKLEIARLPARQGNCLRPELRPRVKLEIVLRVPPPPLCVDSATYIAAYAYFHNNPAPWSEIAATPSLSVE